MKTYVDSATESGMKDMIQFLKQFESVSVQDMVETPGFVFDRKIKFSINGNDYVITWYINQSTISIGKDQDAPQMPFKYLWLDNTFPFVTSTRCIAFSYGCDKKGRQPFESFRIPLKND